MLRWPYVMMSSKNDIVDTGSESTESTTAGSGNLNSHRIWLGVPSTVPPAPDHITFEIRATFAPVNNVSTVEFMHLNQFTAAGLDTHSSFRHPDYFLYFSRGNSHLPFCVDKAQLPRPSFPIPEGRRLLAPTYHHHLPTLAPSSPLSQPYVELTDTRTTPCVAVYQHPWKGRNEGPSTPSRDLNQVGELCYSCWC
jgi:hypothetical protein